MGGHMSIFYEKVQELKKEEREALRDALRKHGKKVDNGWEVHFEENNPIVAGYDWDEPCDIIIRAARVSKEGFLTIIGDWKSDLGNEHEIDPEEIFAGQIEYIIERITA